MPWISGKFSCLGNELKDESGPDLNIPGFPTGNQWSEVKCSTTWPSTPL